MLKYALLGRKGSGRTYFQKLLEKEGLVVAKSYTTREQIDENDNTHHFIEDLEEFSDRSDRLLETVHNEAIYFYTRSELEKADIIPIDPQNLKALCEMFPNTAFRFIEIMASNKDRLTHAVADADDKIMAEEDFIAACEEENEAFIKFEDSVKNRELNIENLTCGDLVNNDFTDDSDLNKWTENIICQRRKFSRILKICKELSGNGMLAMDGLSIHDPVKKYSVPINGEHKAVSPDMLAEIMIFNEKSMNIAIQLWLQLEENSFND